MQQNLHTTIAFERETMLKLKTHLCSISYKLSCKSIQVESKHIILYLKHN